MEEKRQLKQQEADMNRMYDEMRMHHKRLADAATAKLQAEQKAMKTAQTQMDLQQF